MKDSRSSIHFLEENGLKIPLAKIPEETSESRSGKFALDAARSALLDSGVSLENENPERIGLTVSTSKGDLARQIRNPQGFFLEKINSSLMNFFEIKGPCLNLVSACSTGLQSLQWAKRWIEEGRSDVVLAGASDSVLDPFLIKAYERAGILARPQKGESAEVLLKPFDHRRSGTVLGEGAGVLVFESFERARKRNAKIYAEILAVENVADASGEIKMASHGESIQRLLQLLFKKANIASSSIDYVNLHGTGTVWNDWVETCGIKSFFKNDVDHISFSSTKPFTGHMMGASGAVELILSLMCMQHNFIPPTLNLETPDPQCDLDYTPRWGREKKMSVLLGLAYGFGGHVCGVLARKM